MQFRWIAALLLTAGAGAAQAAGMATHASMADFGREALEDGPLKTLLTAHRPSLLAGAIFPDGGYGSGNVPIFTGDHEMSERAHWGDFVITFVNYLREKGCTGQLQNAIIKHPPAGTIDLNQLSDDCGHLIAFAFGDAAHGLTDETWDAQFEPEVRHRGEDPNFGLFIAGALPILPTQVSGVITQLYGATPLNAIEYAMDIVNITEQRLMLNAPTLVFPPTSDLVEIYKRNRPDEGVTAAMIERGNLFARSVVQAESLAAPLDVTRIRTFMPWASANYYTTAGGVVKSGYAVAGMYRQLWDLLTGDPAHPLAPTVIAHYPAAGQIDVKLDQAPDEDWTRLRWIHVFFSTSMDPDSYLQPGALCVFDEAGARVAGTVEAGIYQRDYNHTVKFRLTQALLPNKRYTVVVTPKIKDYRGVPLDRPYSFTFVTAASGS